MFLLKDIRLILCLFQEEASSSPAVDPVYNCSQSGCCKYSNISAHLLVTVPAHVSAGQHSAVQWSSAVHQQSAVQCSAAVQYCT